MIRQKNLRQSKKKNEKHISFILQRTGNRSTFIGNVRMLSEQNFQCHLFLASILKCCQRLTNQY